MTGVSGQPRPVPRDFAAVGALMTNRDLMTHYRVGQQALRRWRQETGVFGEREKKEPAPASFAAVAPLLSKRDLMARYGVGIMRIERWLGETQTTALRKPQGRTRNIASPARIEVQTDADKAADYLRKFGPVSRCDEAGKPNLRGGHWRRGSFVLTDADIMARARRQGWNPDAWKMVA